MHKYSFGATYVGKKLIRLLKFKENVHMPECDKKILLLGSLHIKFVYIQGQVKVAKGRSLLKNLRHELVVSWSRKMSQTEQKTIFAHKPAVISG